MTAPSNTRRHTLIKTNIILENRSTLVCTKPKRQRKNYFLIVIALCIVGVSFFKMLNRVTDTKTQFTSTQQQQQQQKTPSPLQVVSTQCPTHASPPQLIASRSDYNTLQSFNLRAYDMQFDISHVRRCDNESSSSGAVSPKEELGAPSVRCAHSPACAQTQMGSGNVGSGHLQQQHQHQHQQGGLLLSCCADNGALIRVESCEPKKWDAQLPNRECQSASAVCVACKNGGDAVRHTCFAFMNQSYVSYTCTEGAAAQQIVSLCYDMQATRIFYSTNSVCGAVSGNTMIPVAQRPIACNDGDVTIGYYTNNVKCARETANRIAVPFVPMHVFRSCARTVRIVGTCPSVASSGIQFGRTLNAEQEIASHLASPTQMRHLYEQD